MNLRSQSGITLVETIVTAGITALSLGAALYAITMFGKHVAQQGGPARMTAIVTAEQTLRVAQDAWKYGSPGIAPAGTQGNLTTTISSSTGPAQITVTVRYTPEPGRGDPGIASISGEVAAKAPLPGSRVDRPGLIPLPSGAP